MQLSTFDYELPPDLIAQEPTDKRGDSRLLHVSRERGTLGHHQFVALPELLPRDALLVFNDARVIPARLRAKKMTGGKAEILLVRPATLDGETWQVLCKGCQNEKLGGRLTFADGFWGKWVSAPKGGEGVLRFFPHGSFNRLLHEHGEVPLPPYIKRPFGLRIQDEERYQTVYAEAPGSVAAPTAGLHFTERLLEDLKKKGHQLEFVTLHVGLGTFQPIRVENIEKHSMGPESYEITAATASLINQAKEKGRKIVAVGTTTTRALEASTQSNGKLSSGHGTTDLFIVPGYEFKIIDALITNFHLPRSTLLLLVSAFGGWDRVCAAYKAAVIRRYRFFSYGDAMFIS